MRHHALERGTQAIGLEDVLQHRDAEYQLVLQPGVELTEVLNQEATTALEAAGSDALACDRNHGRTQVDAADLGTARSEQTAPASDATTDIEHAGARGHLKMRRQRESLTVLDGAVVELGHA